MNSLSQPSVARGAVLVPGLPQHTPLPPSESVYHWSPVIPTESGQDGERRKSSALGTSEQAPPII